MKIKGFFSFRVPYLDRKFVDALAPTMRVHFMGGEEPSTSVRVIRGVTIIDVDLRDEIITEEVVQRELDNLCGEGNYSLVFGDLTAAEIREGKPLS